MRQKHKIHLIVATVIHGRNFITHPECSWLHIRQSFKLWAMPHFPKKKYHSLASIYYHILDALSGKQTFRVREKRDKNMGSRNIDHVIQWKWYKKWRILNWQSWCLTSLIKISTWLSSRILKFCPVGSSKSLMTWKKQGK